MLTAGYNNGKYSLYFEADEKGVEIMMEAEKVIRRAAMQALLDERYMDCIYLAYNAKDIKTAREEKEKPDTLKDTEPKDKDTVSHLPGDCNDV